MRSSPEQPGLLVGIGASESSFGVLTELVAALPADSGLAFLLTQAPPAVPAAQPETRLAERLATCTAMAVREAEHDLCLQANTLYILGPDTVPVLHGNRLELSLPAIQNKPGQPLNRLFARLAQYGGRRAAGILLPGPGHDGSAGLRDIKAAGGLAIALEPPSSAHDGMPRHAIDTGVVDLIVRASEMPALLKRFASLASQSLGEAPAAEEARPERLSEQELGELTCVLAADLGFDLRVYKSATIERRVLRRMALVGVDRVSAYLDALRQDTDELRMLMRDLLIHVTGFFRDPEAYRCLRELAIDPLVASASAGATLRVWVPGCATGEEPYSIGIEFLEAFRAAGKMLSVKIFATDVNRSALAFGRAGIYPSAIAERVSEQRLQTYFEKLGDQSYRVRPLLRDVVTFAEHDLTRDPPFSRMSLVSCRNLLIYLTPEAQEHVFQLLYYALRPDGRLLLGTSESVGAQSQLFTTISASQRLYQKSNMSPTLACPHPAAAGAWTSREVGARSDAARASSSLAQGSDLARIVLDTLVPPSIIVAGDNSLLFTHGELGPYLRIPEGESPRLELASLLRPNISMRVRSALQKCRRSNEPVLAMLNLEGGRVRIDARPVPAQGNGAVCLSFAAIVPDADAPHATRSTGSAQDAIIEQLEAELLAAHGDLHSTIEELELVNGALRSSNENAMSMTEELQSANEELEATGEELRSLNEELTTVNSQLRENVGELEQAHDDLNNFFSSTEIATVFLDDKLRIKRFTPSARDLLAIDASDAGRCIREMARELLQCGLEDEATSVLEHLTPHTRELRRSDGRWVTRHVLPYRTESRRIEGVVVTFVDITESKSAAEALTKRERQQSVIAALGLRALCEDKVQDFMDHAVREVQSTLNTDFCKVLELQSGGDRLLLRAGVGWPPGLVGSATIGTGLDSQAGYTLHATEPVIVDDLSKEKRFSGPALLVENKVVSGISCTIFDGNHHGYGVIGAHTTRHRSFTREDLDFLQAVAGLIGSAISRHQARVRLALELNVANVLSDAGSLDDVMAPLVANIAGDLGASLGAFWWPARDGTELVCRHLYVDSALHQNGDHKEFGQRSFRAGEGLVGRVYQEGRARWSTDLRNSDTFGRPNEAAALGLLSGFCLPIRSGNEVLGVMTVFSTERLFGDEAFLRGLESIGRAVGDFALRVQAEDRTRASETRKAAIVNASLDGIITIDHEGRVVEFNAAARTIFQYREDETIGRDLTSLIVPRRLRGAYRTALARIVAGHWSHILGKRVELCAMRRDGSELQVELAITQIGDSDQPLYTGFVRDMTEQKRMEDALRDSARQKDEFLAMLGHELRNPLAAIRSAAELLELADGSNATPQLKRTQAVLSRQTARMAKLLDGLLDVSRIMRGKIQLDREIVDWATICSEVASDLVDLQGRNLKIQTEFPDEPTCVEGDRVRLAQIVDNLLSNAIKYTGDGGTVKLSLTRENEQAILTVSDTGIGIEPELLPYIFEVFRQSEQGIDRAHGGLGLGLALVKSLAELQGGTIEARSAGKGCGAAFVVRLPLAIAPAAQAVSPAANPEGPLQILLIEDNEDAAEMMQQVLELWGYQVTVAFRGQEGLALASEQKPQVVLCDLGLPDGMSGFDIAAKLRDNPELGGVRLIALSGYGRPEDKARGAQAGFNAHLTKPVDLGALRRMLVTIGEESGASQ